MEKFERTCICGNKTGTNLGDIVFETYQRHLLPRVHHLKACKKCGFVFADFHSDQSIFDKYYELFSKYEDLTLCPVMNESEKMISQESVANYIENNLHIKKNAHIIDIGCARGDLLKHFKNRGYQNLFGLDPSKECVDICNKMGITAFKGSVAKNDIRIFFDIVLLDNVLEHVYDINGFFKSVLNMLKTKGYLFVRVPDASLYTPLLYTKAYSAFTIEHINHFDHQSLINLGTQHNLRVISTGIDPKEFSGLSAVFRKPLNQDYLTASKACASYLKDSEIMLKERKEYLKKMVSNKKIAVWGIGSYFSRLVAKNFFHDFEIVALIDKDKKKQSQSICGKKIISPEDLHNIRDSFTIVVCAENCGNAIITDIEKLMLNKEVVSV